MFKVTSVVVWEKWGDALIKSVKALSIASTVVAVKVQEQAKLTIQAKDIIDTGALFNSVYVESSVIDQREEAVSAARAAASVPGKHSGKTHDALEGVPGSDGRRLGCAKCAVAMEYGADVEQGIGHKEARPFLKPAADATAQVAAGIAGEAFRAAYK